MESRHDWSRQLDIPIEYEELSTHLWYYCQTTAETKELTLQASYSGFNNGDFLFRIDSMQFPIPCTCRNRMHGICVWTYQNLSTTTTGYLCITLSLLTGQMTCKVIYRIPLSSYGPRIAHLRLQPEMIFQPSFVIFHVPCARSPNWFCPSANNCSLDGPDYVLSNRWFHWEVTQDWRTKACVYVKIASHVSSCRAMTQRFGT